MRNIEKLLLGAEDLPWSILYRAAIGFVLLPAFFALGGKADSVSRMLLFFIALLLGLRIAPMFGRRLLPFSTEARTIWAERRILAKRYDSYQWQKLLGIGFGLGLYLGVTRRFSAGSLLLAGGCLVFGALGLFFWRRRRRTFSEPTAVPSAAYGAQS